MQDLLQALGDPATREWYLVFCFALLVLPMIALSYWYHTRIKRSKGGRNLMAKQATRPNLPDGISMMRDIASGRYGQSARAMQNRVYVLLGCWIVVNVVAFGILLWADEFNRAAAG
ncbi:MAG: hypothetical protein R3D62_05115 [Xanthobacteraceae bacterium]